MIPITSIFNNLWRTIVRFPMPILSALLAFSFLVFEIHFSRRMEPLVHDYRFVKFFLECVSGISIFFAFDIFGESNAITISKKLGLYILGFCILGLHFYSITPGMFGTEPIFVSRYLIFMVCFHLMISFIAYNLSSNISSFWQFNYYLFSRIVTSLLYSLTLFLGLGSAMWALVKLFGVHFNSDFYVDLAALIFLIFNTLFFLKDFPMSYNVFNRPIVFKKSVRIFVQYILMPILGVYFFILYVYMFKIVWTQHFPSGWVCIPILIFSIIGILSYLLIYPIRLEDKARTIFVFAKNYFYVLLPLLSLYFIAIYKRIMPYGVTEDRYLVFILGCWLVIISIYIIVSKKDNIIIIPISLFLLLSLSAIGPWGMFQLSIQNQVSRLEHLLKRNHLLNDGKLVQLANDEHVSNADAASIRSIVSYLNRRGEIKRIHPWLSSSDQEKLDSAIAKNDLYYINSLIPNVAIVETTPFDLHYYFSSKENNLAFATINLEGYNRMAQFSCGLNSSFEETINDSLKVVSKLQQNELEFYQNQKELFKISLQEKLAQLIAFDDSINVSRNARDSSRSSLNIVDESSLTKFVPKSFMSIDVDKCKLLINSIGYSKRDTSYSIDLVEGYLLMQ